MQYNTETKSNHFLSIAKIIFLKWEKWRIGYNLVLLVTMLAGIVSTGNAIFYIKQKPFVLMAWLFYCICANICYFAGPIIDTYFNWLEIKHSSIIAKMIWLLGIIVSIPLVLSLTLGPLIFMGID